jgi:hypothetical protein
MFSYNDIQRLKTQAIDVKLVITGFGNTAPALGNPNHGLWQLADVIEKLCDYVDQLRTANEASKA